MPKSRQNRSKKRPKGRPRRLGPTVRVVKLSPSSAAQPAVASALPASTEAIATTVPDEKPSWYLPDDSKVRTTALQIMAMRIAGMSDEDIARDLKISVKSISPYVYRAAKNGWIELGTPKDVVQYKLLNKVVERLEEGLEDGARHNTSGMRVRTAVALAMGKGTLFDTGGNDAPVDRSTVVAVQVVMPPNTGSAPTMREDTIGGIPSFVDAEVAKGQNNGI